MHYFNERSLLMGLYVRTIERVTRWVPGCYQNSILSRPTFSMLLGLISVLVWRLDVCACTFVRWYRMNTASMNVIYVLHLCCAFMYVSVMQSKHCVYILCTFVRVFYVHVQTVKNSVPQLFVFSNPFTFLPIPCEAVAKFSAETTFKSPSLVPSLRLEHF